MKIEDRLSDALHDYADRIEPELGSWTKIASRFADEPAHAPKRPARAPLVLAGVALALIVVLVTVLVVRDDGDNGSRVVTRPSDVPSTQSRIRPPGVLAATTSGHVESMDSAGGQVHETPASIPGVASLSAIPPDGLDAVYGTLSKAGPCAEPRIEVGTVHLASGALAPIVRGATSPIVSPDGRFVVYGIQCDGVTPGFSDLRDGENYRVDPFPAGAKKPRLRGFEPLAWAPDSERILYEAVFEGSEDPSYWIGRVRPTEADMGSRVVPGARLSAATFVGNRTLAIAADDHGRSRVRFVDLQFRPVPGGRFEVPGRVDRLVVDPAGRHFLAVTLSGDLYRWSRGDDHPTKLASGVRAATWLPWS